jgi:formimidoylglutamate deiminase
MLWAVRREGDRLVLPGFTTAHSHAFQRGMRGGAQRKSRAGDPRDDFWTWRAEMYRCATELTPESFERVTRIAFEELVHAGVRTVGEFHYVHHQADGTPYDDRTLLSDIAIRVAKELGLRIALLRCAYFRAGPGREREDGQRRFCDPGPDAVLRDVETLRARYKGDSNVVVGLAPHSVRAVPPEFLKELIAYANQHSLPLHMHVSEQAREVSECVAETGKRPVEYLADIEALSARFVAVHATCIEPNEADLFAEANATVCVCPTTERDLGDGLLPLSELRRAGVALCTGIDSHVITDPFDDMRSLETHERLRIRERVTFVPSAGTPAEALLLSATQVGERACGFGEPSSPIAIDVGHPALRLVPEDRLLDAVVFSGSPALLKP